MARYKHPSRKKRLNKLRRRTRWAPFWTVPAGFLVAIILVLGTFQILFAFILPTISTGLLCILTILANVFSDFVMTCTKIPFSQILIGKPRLTLILAICLLIFLWKLLNFRRFFVNFIYFFVIFLLFFAIFCENLTKFDKNLRVWLLSVGHGQAAILHINGKTTLIDAGSISQNNIGGNIVNPFLDYTAQNKINSIFISHDDIDHYNGLPEKDVIKFWMQTRKDFLEVVKYFMSEFTNKEIKNIGDLSDAIINLGKEHYLPYSRHFLKNSFNINSRALAFITSKLIPFRFKQLYFSRLLKEKKIYPRILINKRSPDVVIFGAAPHILFGLNEDLTLDKENFMNGLKTLRKVYPTKAKTWEELSQDYANAYILFYLMKIV